MTLRGLAIAWVAAVFVCAIVSIAVVYAGQNRLDARMAQSDVVFLGSSLTRNALPDHNSVLPLTEIEADAVLRFGISRGSEAELLTLARTAVDAGVQRVFVEANPLFSRLANDPTGCGYRYKIVSAHKALQQSGQFVFQGRDVGAAVAIRDGQKQGPNHDAIDIVFPMRTEGPCAIDAWTSLINRAAETQFFLISFPRDEFANRLIGAEMLADFEQAAGAIGTELGVQILRLDALGPWETALFIDQSHFNQRGAERFRAELAIWWADHQ